jgi:hypothetical protein
VIGNPDTVTHTLTIRTNLIGIDPYWKVKLLIDPGDPPPDMLNPGEILVGLNLTFEPALGANAPSAPPADPFFGDVSMVQVEVLLDGQPYSGFTVQFVPPPTSIYLPLLKR